MVLVNSSRNVWGQAHGLGHPYLVVRLGMGDIHLEKPRMAMIRYIGKL
jgi:hypothetical protein